MDARVVVQRMTDEQKKMVRDADPRNVKCSVTGSNDLFEGFVKVPKRKAIFGVVARTGRIFDDSVEAMDAAEAIVRELLSEDDEPEKPKETKEEIAKRKGQEAANKKAKKKKAAADKKAADKAAAKKKKEDEKKKKA